MEGAILALLSMLVALWIEKPCSAAENQCEACMEPPKELGPFFFWVHNWALFYRHCLFWLLMYYYFSSSFELVLALNLIKEIRPNPVFTRIKRLLFADDTLLFYAGLRESILTVKVLLLAFEDASCLWINFYKKSYYLHEYVGGEDGQLCHHDELQ